MKLSTDVGRKTFQINSAAPLDIAIPLRFNESQPNVYGAKKASARACEAEGIVGDTRRGGSCNFERYEFTPHCNGTHTECVGHVTDERISVHECLRDVFILATLISVEPEKASGAGENYPVEFGENDRIISRRGLEKKLEKTEVGAALIIRTLPNGDDKLTKSYAADAPFFSTEAMRFIAKKNICHLLADVPSIDRLFDEGKLSNHRIFWNLKEGAKTIDENTRVKNTVTELIYAPAEIADGVYLLNLQIPAFITDAAPSRPILFEILK